MSRREKNILFKISKIILSLVMIISLFDISSINTYATEVEEEQETEEIVDSSEETEETEETSELVTYTAEAGDIKVSVETYSDALPENAELVATLYDEDSDEYSEASDIIELDDDSSMVALDILFMVDGEEVEPTQEVSVTIDASAVIDEDVDASTIEVQHLEENDNNITPTLVADSQEESEGTITDAIAEFTVDSFSTFTITWSAGGGGNTKRQQITATTYLTGTSTTIGSGNTTISANSGTTVDLTSSNSDLAIDGYTLTSAKITYNGTTYDATDITVEISVSTTGQGWQQTTTTTYTVTYTDSSGTTHNLVSNSQTSPTITIALYYTPDPSITISEDSGNDTDGYTLSAKTDSYYDYDTDDDGTSDIIWSLDNDSKATITDNSDGTITVK
ncbi:MAG: hypothetical protein LUG60_07825 [Erysipelotrichaceae bacterium]|nr:hypothetical protein [Erysipelotrichaceae bacterium]